MAMTIAVSVCGDVRGGGNGCCTVVPDVSIFTAASETGDVISLGSCSKSDTSTGIGLVGSER